MAKIADLTMKVGFKRSDGAVFEGKDPRGHNFWRLPNGVLDMEICFDGDPGKTEQQHAPECDLEYIISKYVESGTPIQIQESDFTDFTQQPTAIEAMQALNRAKEAFLNLPLAIRRRFDHNPGAFMDGLRNPALKDELIELGVFQAPQSAPAGQETGSQPVSDTTAAGGGGTA